MFRLSCCAAALLTLSLPQSLAQETVRVSGSSSPDCPLVIVGGALKDTNESVYSAFLSGLKAEGDLIVVPVASGAPVDSAKAMQDVFVAYGIEHDRIKTAPLAVTDDPGTDDVDESAWAGNGASPELGEAFANAAGIWFVGGDQARIGDTLNPAGKGSPGLDGLRTACRTGAVVGGTSAGAAMMSDLMLVQGDSLPALLGEKDAEKGALLTQAGLGFFEGGVIDQHFDARSRLGRLIVALEKVEDPADRIGYGVDEDTALVRRSDGLLQVQGAGSVVVVDARNANLTLTDAGALKANGLVLSVLTQGDTLNPSNREVQPAEGKSATVGNEYFERPQPGGGGMALPQASLSVMLGEALLDNSAATALERASFDESGRAVIYAFAQTKESAGYWGKGPDGVSRFTIEGVRFDILPATVTLERLP